MDEKERKFGRVFDLYFNNHDNRLEFGKCVLQSIIDNVEWVDIDLENESILFRVRKNDIVKVFELK